MVKVVIVNGMPESGKTTMQIMCREFLKRHGWGCIIKSSVEWVKEIALQCGWNGVKDDKNRKFLSDLKKLLTDWDDAVLKHLVEEIDRYHYTGDNYVIFVDIREPFEIAKAKKEFNATTVIVRRPQVECNYYSNSSDMEVFDYEYDETIWNDSDKLNLENGCEMFINTVLINADNVYKKEESYL